MSFMRVLKRQVRAAMPPLVFLSVFGYFAWHVKQGARGLDAFAVREQQLKAAQAALADAEAERDRWEVRTAGLRNQRLNLDTLDERARAMLNLADPGEIVVPYPTGQRLY